MIASPLRRIRSSLYLAALLAAALLACGPARGGTVLEERVQGHPVYAYLPEGHDPQQPAPLLVVLHGCDQGAEQIARLSGLNELAEAQGFVALYPQTRASLLNMAGCWRWWDPANQRRSGPEPSLIMAAIGQVRSRVAIDPQRIYVLGLSSGGAMSATLGSIYPEVFAAVGVHSGLPYGAATSVLLAPWAQWGFGPSGDALGERAHQAQGPTHRPLPAIVVHGSRDWTVWERNAGRLVEQMAQMNDLGDNGRDDDSVDARAEQRTEHEPEQGLAYVVEDYADESGQVLLRKIIVQGMGHAWSGGAAGQSYSEPAGPDAARLMWVFFSAHPMQ